MSEQAFGGLDDQLMNVLFLGFFFCPHNLTILQNISSVTMVLAARAMRFPQIGGWYLLRQFALVRHFVLPWSCL
jgi:hypothetical protein